MVHRSDGSGTTAIFTHYLAETCSAWKDKVGEGKSVSWPIGIGGKGNEGVANYVKQTPYSIGYVEYAYAKQNNLVSVTMKNAAGNFVEPSLKTFSNAAETGYFDPKKDFAGLAHQLSGKNLVAHRRSDLHSPGPGQEGSQREDGQILRLGVQERRRHCQEPGLHSPAEAVKGQGQGLLEERREFTKR